MKIEMQSEDAEETRIRLTLSTLNVDTHSRIQELSPANRMKLESALRGHCDWVVAFITSNTTKKTA
jgi:hypothetical protein